MSMKNLKKLVFMLIPIMSMVILIQNPVMVALASPASNSNSNGAPLAGNSPMGGNEGFGTGGPEVIAKLLSEGNTSNPDSTTSNNMAPNSGLDTNVFHTKELNVTKHTLRAGDTSDAITGTIVNNSPGEVNYVDINAALFDANNNLIGTVSGTVDFPTLKSGEDTTFKIDVYPDTKKLLDHYMLFVLGTPKME
jgi:hypothetical protein